MRFQHEVPNLLSVEFLQCCRFGRNTAYVNLKIVNFYYKKKYLLGQSIQKLNNLNLKKTSLGFSTILIPVVGGNSAFSRLECDSPPARCFANMGLRPCY